MQQENPSKKCFSKVLSLLKMYLAQAVLNYVAAYEGHTSAAGIALVQLREMLRRATIPEIITENNKLTMQRLWSSPLMDLFYDELLHRILIDTTFSLTTAWDNEWAEDPFIVGWVGFEDSYPSVANNNQSKSVAWMNRSFDDQISELIIKMLMNGPFYATIYEAPSGELRLTELVNANNSIDKIRLGTSEDYPVVKVLVEVRPDPDWEIINKIYQGLRKMNPVIVDPPNGGLIDQLIDLQLAEKIVHDEGIMIEGDLLLSAELQEDELARS